MLAHRVRGSTDHDSQQAERRRVRGRRTLQTEQGIRAVHHYSAGTGPEVRTPAKARMNPEGSTPSAMNQSQKDGDDKVPPT